MRAKRVRLILLCVGLAVALVGGGILLSFYRDTALSFFGVTVRVLDLLGIGLTSAAGVLMTLYRRLRRRMPVRLPAPLVFRVGNWPPPPQVPFILADGIDLDCPRLLGPDQISCSETESNFRLEWELTKQREAIVEAYSRGALCHLTDGQIVRLENFSLLRVPGDEQPHWRLTFSPVSYYDFVCTNLALTGSMRLTELPGDALAVLRQFRREIDASPPDFHAVFSNRKLANGLTLHLNVIDIDHKLLVGRRPRNLSIFPDKLVTSVTGAVAWADRAGQDLPPDPFIAAVREAYEETGIELRRQDIRFYALGMQADQRHPLLLGEANIDARLADVVRLSKDAWENERFYYLDLDNLDLCASVLVYGEWLPASAVAVCLALLVRHGYRKVAEAFDGAQKNLFRRWLNRGDPRRHRARWHLLA
ncbi:MAG: hypothetical protein AB1776_04820 [Bacillota bacterium]